MDRLRTFGWGDWREAGIVAGGTLTALGLEVMAQRAETGIPWSPGVIFAVNLAALTIVVALGVGIGPTAGARRPGLVALAVFVGIATLLALSMWLDATPDPSFQVMWIATAVAVTSIYLRVRTGSTFALLAAGIAALVAWSALWDVILSGGLGAHFTAFRIILLVAAVALVAVSRLVPAEDGPELLTGAALAATLAVGLGALDAVFFLAFSEGGTAPMLASNSGAWELAHLAVTLAVFQAAIRTGARELGIVGAVSLLFLVGATGEHFSVSTVGLVLQSHKIVFWPLALAIIGVLMTFEGLRSPRTRREDPLSGLASLGAIVFAAGMYAVLLRRQGIDSRFATFVYALIAEAGLIGVAVASVRRSHPAWVTAPAATAGVLAAPVTLGLFLNWADTTPKASFSVFWIFALSALLGFAALRATGVRFPLLLAGLFVIASFSGACAWLLPHGISGTTTAYRVLLVPLAAALAFGAIRFASRSAAGEPAMRIGPPGSELFFASALTLVIAFAYGEFATQFDIFSGIFGLVAGAKNSTAWDILLIAATAAILVGASASGSRAIGVPAGIGFWLAVIILGQQQAGPYPSTIYPGLAFQTPGKVLFWPLALIVIGLALAGVSAVRRAPATDEPGGVAA